MKTMKKDIRRVVVRGLGMIYGRVVYRAYRNGKLAGVYKTRRGAERCLD